MTEEKTKYLEESPASLWAKNKDQALENALTNNPGLTREKALAELEAHGF